MSKCFGETLRELRRKNELTQREVAEHLNVERSTYAYYERGTTEPSLETARKLAGIFNVSLEDLLPQSDNHRLVRVGDPASGTLMRGSEGEEDFLDCYRNLTPEQKEKLRAFARQLESENK